MQFDVESRSGTYQVVVESGSSERLEEFCVKHSALHSGRVFFLCDDRTVPIAERLRSAFRDSARKSSQLFVLPSGEGAKNIRQVQMLWERLVGAGAKRDSVVVAVGGGLVGDVAGFVAATLYRGIALVHVPTSLMAQVDSCVGGKTGINLCLPGENVEIKNAIGSFYPPKLVVVDPQLLATLSDREFRGGLSEVVKYGVLFSRGLFDRVVDLGRGRELPDSLIADCLRIKANVVGEDEFESGDKRVLLNFGHTVGHALERATQGPVGLSHGEAVALGMVIEASFAVSLRLTPQSVFEEIRGAVERLSLLPAPAPSINLDAALAALTKDKKISEEGLILPVVVQVGEGRIERVSVAALTKYMEEFLANYRI